MGGINEMCGKLEQYSLAEISKEKEKVNSKDLGEAIDMMKDLSEIKKNKAEENYYNSLVEAMESSEYGVDYDYEGRIGRGKFYQDTMDRRGYSSRVNNQGRSQARRGYDDDYRMNDMMSGRMGYSNNSMNQPMRSGNSSSRYGYSHDEYMEAKQMYSPTDPEGKRKRMEMLDDYMEDLTDSAKELIQDMSPEEKQTWKMKLSKIINM